MKCPNLFPNFQFTLQKSFWSLLSRQPTALKNRPLAIEEKEVCTIVLIRWGCRVKSCRKVSYLVESKFYYKND